MAEEMGLDALLGGVDELGGIDAETTFESDKLDFDRPVAGQSLTEAPGSNAWETPPQYADPKEAMDKLFNSFMQPVNAKQLLRIMDAGVPVASMAEPILMHGVQEGKWSLDTAMYIAPSVLAVLSNMAERAGVEYTMEQKKEEKVFDLSGLKSSLKKKKEEVPKMEDFLQEEDNGPSDLMGERK